MKPILKYPGAKNRIAPWICKYIPDHRNYIEPFFGGGAVFFQKDPSYIEIINDMDGEVVNYFRVIRNRKEEFIDKIALTPYSREEYLLAFEESTDEIERARRFAIKCFMGFGCANINQTGFRRGISETAPNPAKRWAELPEELQYAMKRLKNAQIEQMDAIKLLQDVRGENTFIYCDPPYLPETRKRKQQYHHEMTEAEHEKLLKLLLQKDCKVMISGYENPMYDELLKGWEKYSKHTLGECSVSRTETIWLNYKLDGQYTLF